MYIYISDTEHINNLFSDLMHIKSKLHEINTKLDFVNDIRTSTSRRESTTERSFLHNIEGTTVPNKVEETTELRFGGNGTERFGGNGNGTEVVVEETLLVPDSDWYDWSANKGFNAFFEEKIDDKKQTTENETERLDENKLKQRFDLTLEYLIQLFEANWILITSIGSITFILVLIGFFVSCLKCKKKTRNIPVETGMKVLDPNDVTKPIEVPDPNKHIDETVV